MKEYGWSEHWQKEYELLKEGNSFPARVVREDKDTYLVVSEDGESAAKVSGSFMHKSMSRGDFPAVGDWVVAGPSAGKEHLTIHHVLPRKSKLSRKVAGSRTEEQVLAANVDTAFIINGLDRDFNPRRIERYMALGWDSGANPVVVLNKADLCDDLDSCVGEVEMVSAGVPVIVMSAIDGRGVEELRGHIAAGSTVIMIGSSGVGKSTIINLLIGEEVQATQATSDSIGKGVHTTTRRELFRIPGGGLMIDSPGMRELQMWGGEDGLKKTFDDIEELRRSCRFSDCQHGTEPGCAVRKALENGSLDPDRYKNYLKLLKEIRFQARREDHRAQQVEKNRWKKIMKDYKAKQKFRDRE